MGKRLLSTLLAVCMIFSLASTAFAENTSNTAGGVDYDNGEHEYLTGYNANDTFAVGSKLYAENTSTTFTLEIFSSKNAANRVYQVTSSGTDKIELQRTYTNSGASGTHAGIPNEHDISAAKWKVKSNDNNVLQLYPQVMGVVKFVNGDTDTDNLVWYVSGESGEPYTDVDLDINGGNTKQTTLPEPRKENYKFNGWYSVAQTTDTTAPAANKVTIDTLDDLCVKNSNLTATIYAHYDHVHTWKYVTSEDGKRGYLYCTADYDEFDDCRYKLAAGETAASSKIYVDLDAKDVAWNGSAYADANRTHQWYVKTTEGNYAAVADADIKAIDTDTLSTPDDSWYYTVGGDTYQTDTTADKGAARSAGAAPVELGYAANAGTIKSYAAHYNPFENNNNVDKTAATNGVKFEIQKANQPVSVNMTDYDYNVATVPQPSYTNGTPVLEDEHNANDNIHYYYSSDYDGTSDLTTATWTLWPETIDGDDLAVGDYYMLLVIDESTHYNKLTSVKKFTVGGTPITNTGAEANVTVAVAGDNDNDNKVTYDGQNHGIVAAAKTGDALASAANCKVEYKATENGEYSATSPAYKDAGTYTVYYKVSADGYKTLEDSLTFTIESKTLYAVATAKNKTYDGKIDATLDVKLYNDEAHENEGTGVDGEAITVTIPASFEDVNVAYDNGNVTAKAVCAHLDNRTETPNANTKLANYTINYSAVENLTATISPLAAEFEWTVKYNDGTDHVVKENAKDNEKFDYNKKPYTVTAIVNNAIDNDTFAPTYETDAGNAKITNTATQRGKYTARVSGLGNTNYTLTGADADLEWEIAWVGGNQTAIISDQVKITGSDWYKSNVKLSAPTGFLISKTGADNTWASFIEMTEEGADRTQVYYLKDSTTGGLTDILRITPDHDINIDKTAPKLEISFKTNKFAQWLNDITFKHFYKETLEITITADDDNGTLTYADGQVSGTSEIKYAIIEKGTADNWTWPAAESASINWQTYDANNKPSVDPAKSFVVYAYATDNAGNKCEVIRTDGTVVYTDATESATVTYTKLSNVDVETGINIGTNTIREVYNMTLDAEHALNNENNKWYTVNAGKKIVLEADSLNTLTAGTYQLHVTYNPNGEAYVQGTDPDNVDANKSVITLNVVKANDTNVPAAPTVIADKTTTSSITLNEISAIEVDTNYGKRTIPVEYSCNGGLTWQSSPVFTGLSSGTTYSFTARYAATDDFNASEASAATQGTTIAVKRSSRGGGSSATYYTITVTAGANGTADTGKVTVRSGRSRTINFTPDAGYVVADVVVNGKSVGAYTSYTLSNVTRDTTVKVTFVKSGNAVIVPTQTVINPSTGAKL